MLKNGLLLGLLFATALIIAFPVAGQAQVETGSNFVLVNYIGQDITLDLDDVTYTVPGTNANPEGGRFELQLASGEHKYAVTVAAVGGSAGEFTLEPGGMVAKAVHIVTGDPVVDKDGILLVKPRDKVEVFDFDPLATVHVAGISVADTWQPIAAAPGLGSIVWVNYSGTDELTVDLAGQLFKVAPQNHGIPGRLQVDVPPGFYRYTASVPYGSINGELSLGPGEVIGLNVIPDIREEPEYKVGEEFEIPPVKLHQFQESLTARVSTLQPQADTVPPVLPAAGDEVAPTEIEAAVVPAGLLLKNYTGDTVVFTIDNQVYFVPDNTEETILLTTPGSYNYTASLPFVATTGTVNLTEGHGVELSIAINLARDFLSVYQN